MKIYFNKRMPFPFKISFHLRINNLIFFYQMSLIENKMIRKMKERKGKAVLSQRLLDHDQLADTKMKLNAS